MKFFLFDLFCAAFVRLFFINIAFIWIPFEHRPHTTSNKHRTIYSFHSSEWMKCLWAFVEHYWLMRDSLIEFISVVFDWMRGEAPPLSFVSHSFAHIQFRTFVCAFAVSTLADHFLDVVSNERGVFVCANTADKSFQFTQWTNGS